MTRKWFVRGVSLLLSILMLLSLAACKAKPVEEESSEAPSAGESSVAEESKAESESSEEPEVSAEEEPDPANTNLLTGLPTLTDGAIGARPVAVMINNSKGALPQNGVSFADVLFEVPIEGDETRLMGVFGDYTQMPTIGSVRSCRYYFPIFALSFDAVYVNWGIDPTIAKKTVASLKDLDHFDGIQVGYGFGRDQARLDAGVALEHTAMLYGEKVPSLLEKYETRIELQEEWKSGVFHFAKQDETVIPTGDKADFVKINFGGQQSRFTYNAETHLYEKLYGKNPHIDNVNGEQLKFANLIVIETDISVRDKIGRKNINWQGGEEYTGWYFTEGARQPIIWSKADEYSKIELFNENGEPLTMNRGKTYIAVVYRDRVSLENDLG